MRGNPKAKEDAWHCEGMLEPHQVDPTTNLKGTNLCFGRGGKTEERHGHGDQGNARAMKHWDWWI